MRFRSICTVFGGVIALGGTAIAAYAGGSSAQGWQLDVKFHDPQRISIQLPGDRHETTFWYLLYEVTNETGRDVEFYPSFSLVTDTLRVVIAGDNISPSVYDAIAARHKGEFPFFAPPVKVTGLLLQGRANARASAAVFRMFDKEASRFTIYCSGFSSELRRLANPAFDANERESQENARYFMLRRTLAVEYNLAGDAETRGRGKPVRRTRQWVMR